MAIDPLGSAGVPESGQKRTGQVSPVRSDAASAAPGRPEAGDSVELSAEARRLAAPDIPEFTLPETDLRKMTQRIADGTYNSDQVIADLARKLSTDLG